MTQLAAVKDIFAKYGVENFLPSAGESLEESANFTVFFGADDVVALINWKTLAEDLKRIGIVDESGDLRSWRYDEIHGYFIHLSKSEIGRLKELEPQKVLDKTSDQSNYYNDESLVLKKLHNFGYNQIKSVSYITNSKFGNDLWRLDFKLNPVYATNKKLIEAIVADFSQDLLTYADIGDDKIGNLKRWHFNKRDHHPVAFLSNEELYYFLSSLKGCDGEFLQLEGYEQPDLSSGGENLKIAVNENSQKITGELPKIPITEEEDGIKVKDENSLSSVKSDRKSKFANKYQIAVKDDVILCKDSQVLISNFNIFGVTEEVYGARLEYSDGNICFIDPVAPTLLQGKVWESVGGLSEKIYNQVKINRKLIKSINKKAKICGQSTVMASLISSGLIDSDGSSLNSLPALSYSAVKGGHDFGILHSAISIDLMKGDAVNFSNLLDFFQNILTQIAIDDKFEEYRIPIALKSELSEDDDSKLLLLVAQSFVDAIESVTSNSVDLSDKNIILCCDNEQRQKSMINNFRSIEFSRFGS